MNINATRALALLKDYWSFDNDYVERGKAGQRIPGWNWEEKSGDEKEKVSLRDKDLIRYPFVLYKAKV